MKRFYSEKDPVREQRRLEQRCAQLEENLRHEESECREMFAVLRRAVGGEVSRTDVPARLGGWR